MAADERRKGGAPGAHRSANLLKTRDLKRHFFLRVVWSPEVSSYKEKNRASGQVVAQVVSASGPDSYGCGEFLCGEMTTSLGRPSAVR